VKRRRGVRVVSQRKGWDCGVACLAMWLQVPYGDVAAMVRAEIDPRKLRRRGMAIADVRAIAEHFGVDVRVVHRSRGYLARNPDGILGVIGGRMDRAGHWVVLKAGAIVDPDGGEVWSVPDYMKRFRCRSTVLLVEA
jgi:ABC-type bacteriocin/lantibiotic exporter with double-glycine peptidase domain